MGPALAARSEKLRAFFITPCLPAGGPPSPSYEQEGVTLAPLLFIREVDPER